MLAAVLIFSVVTRPSDNPHGLMPLIAVMLAVPAMARQHALLRLALPKVVSTAVMTGNLTNATLALIEMLACVRLQRHSATAKQHCPSSSTVVRHSIDRAATVGSHGHHLDDGLCLASGRLARGHSFKSPTTAVQIVLKSTSIRQAAGELPQGAGFPQAYRC